MFALTNVCSNPTNRDPLGPSSPRGAGLGGRVRGSAGMKCKQSLGRKVRSAPSPCGHVGLPQHPQLPPSGPSSMGARGAARGSCCAHGCVLFSPQAGDTGPLPTSPSPPALTTGPSAAGMLAIHGAVGSLGWAVTAPVPATPTRHLRSHDPNSGASLSPGSSRTRCPQLLVPDSGCWGGYGHIQHMHLKGPVYFCRGQWPWALGEQTGTPWRLGAQFLGGGGVLRKAATLSRTSFSSSSR